MDPQAARGDPRHQHGGHADLLVQAAQPPAQLLADLGVEGAEGLVEQQHPRLDRQRSRQRHSLALAARQLGGVAFGALDARVRKELREWLRRLHDEVHVTTVLVTHDQEEAMEVSDRVVLMNEGRIEQIGKPRDLYEHPANEFVMSFVGPVNRLGDGFVRPHDIELRLEPNGSTSQAAVERVVYLGFEVRVELALDGGERLWAQVTRDEARRLGLDRGHVVFIRPSHTRVFNEAAG